MKAIAPFFGVHMGEALKGGLPMAGYATGASILTVSLKKII